MKETYQEMKARHQKEVNDFPLGFAFSNKQFDEMMKKWNLDPKKDLDKICSIGAGGFVQKKDSERMNNMFDKIEQEEKEAMKDDDFLISAFEYELGNHEYIITGEFDDTLEALNLTVEEVTEDKRMLECLYKARQNYLKSMEEMGY